MPATIWEIKHKDAHAPFVYEHPAEKEEIQLLKNTSCFIPIDAKFDADFKNVYFYMFILSWSRVISQKPPFLSLAASNVQKRWFFVYNSWTTQDKRMKVFIFGNSIKFCLLLCNMRCFEKVKSFLAGCSFTNGACISLFCTHPDGGWHLFIKLDHLIKKIEGCPTVI